MAILVDLRDPRIQDVTVTYVEVAPDLRTAKVHVSVMGDEKKQKLSLSGLQHSAGFLQQKIGNRLDTRYIPRLRFVLDKGVKHSIEMARILNEVLPKELEESSSEDADAESTAAADPLTDSSNAMGLGSDQGSNQLPPERVDDLAGPIATEDEGESDETR